MLIDGIVGKGIFNKVWWWECDLVLSCILLMKIINVYKFFVILWILCYNYVNVYNLKIYI